MGDIKIFNIEQLKQKFNLEGFLETGTLYGDTVAHYKNQFKELHSIEINSDLAIKAKNN